MFCLYRNNVIWTHDFLFPKQARYQAALYSVEESRIRTYDKLNLTDLQSATFNHSAISSTPF